jgi:hypothetical protein
MEEVMKKLLITVLFLFPLVAWAEKPNPAEFTVNVHVQSSHIKQDCGSVSGGSNFCEWSQHLTVLIDGKKFELVGPTTSKKIHSLPGSTIVLHIGDYKAKALTQVNEHAYEYSMSYEFLFSDGETRKYFVVGESE